MNPIREQYDKYAKEFKEEFEKIIYSHPHLNKHQKDLIFYHVSAGVIKGTTGAYYEITLLD